MSSDSSEHSSMRQRNLARIARAVRDAGVVSQSALVESTGLAVGAVSSLVNALVDARVLAEADQAPAKGRGRPRRMLSLADGDGLLLGVRVTRMGITALAATALGRELRRLSAKIPEGAVPAEVGERAARLLDALRAESPELVRPVAATISVPGHAGLQSASSIELGWYMHEIDPLLRPLRDAGVPLVRAGNDGALATIGEVRASPSASSNAAVLLLTEGIGGGVVSEGSSMLRQRAGLGYGHVPVAEGPSCPCGRAGCLELYSSLSAFARGLGEDGVLHDIGDDAYARDLSRRAVDGDAAVLEVLARGRSGIARFEQVASAIFHPDEIVLTGAGGALAPWLTPLRHPRPEPEELRSPTPVVEGRLGAEAALVGAVLDAQDLLFDEGLARLTR